MPCDKCSDPMFCRSCAKKLTFTAPDDAPAPKSAAAILEDARTWLLGHGRYGEHARSDMGMFSLALGRDPLSAERQRAIDAVVAHVFNCESVWGLRWTDAWQRAIDAVREG